MEKSPTFFDHVRNSGLVEVKKLKRLVESLRVRKRILHDTKADYRSQVSLLKKVAGYDHLPPLEQYLAREFLRLGWLNVWQISQLIEGRRRFTLGEYHILDSLGQGGYAHVFLAKSGKTSELVAIKVFQTSQSQPEVLARFLREALLQESISHKNIVRLINCEQDGNVDYLVFEYMAGGDVRRLIRKEVQLPILQSVRIIAQAATALAYLHSQGIVHRDVKPANILLTASGVAKLGDLGLCGFLDLRAESDPRFGKLVGTADYMAPDHILNPCQSSPQWDIYSLGCTFYQMVTGTVPFPKDNSREKVMAHLRSELVDPRVFREDLPEELSLIVARMMAKTPALRFQTMTDVLESLTPWCDDTKAVVAGLAGEPEHVVVDVKTLQKLRDYFDHAHDESDGGDQVETLDLAAVGDVPLEIEIYGLHRPDEEEPDEERSSGFNFELPAGQIDEDLPLRFDQKSLFEFVSTFEEAIRMPVLRPDNIPTWRIDTLSKLRCSLPLPLRLRFAKREVVMRRFARQMRGGYVLDPLCGGERSHLKTEPTFRWYFWWWLSVRPYDAYHDCSLSENPAEEKRFTFGEAQNTEPKDGKLQPFELPQDSDSRTTATEYIRVQLPGHAESIVIEVPPMMIDQTNDETFPVKQNRGNASERSAAKSESRNKRSPRPFEPRTLLFWLFVAMFGLLSAFAVVLSVMVSKGLVASG